MHTRRIARLLAPLIALALFAAPALAAPDTPTSASTSAALVASSSSADAGPTTAPAPTGPPIAVGSDSAVTPAAGTPGAKAQQDPVATATQIAHDIRDGASGARYAIAGALALLMVGGIRWGGKLFGKNDRDKSIVVMILAMLGTLSTALASSTPITPSLLFGAVSIAFMAVGGRTWLSRVLWPADDGGHLLEWLKPFLGYKPPAAS